MTTIKVPVALRDRVNRDAGERGFTAAELIALLIDDYERARRMDAFGRAFAEADDGYQEVSDEWAAADHEWPNA